MNRDLLDRANALSADIRYMEGFIAALPKANTTNALFTIKLLCEDYHETALDYLNTDLLELLQKAKRTAELNLEELKDHFAKL